LTEDGRSHVAKQMTCTVPLPLRVALFPPTLANAR
jgi:hypothetical protein